MFIAYVHLSFSDEYDPEEAKAVDDVLAEAEAAWS